MTGIKNKGATSIVRLDDLTRKNKYTTYIYGDPPLQLPKTASAVMYLEWASGWNLHIQDTYTIETNLNEYIPLDKN
jgi:hypothetical protein